MAGEPHRRRRLAEFQERAEGLVTRALLVGIFVLGLVAQFVKPVGDALEDKAFLGGALLSLVAYVLYSAVQKLVVALNRPVPKDRMPADELADYFDEAFKRKVVRIDFIGYTGESLVRQVDRRLEKLKTDPGRTEEVAIRILLPDFTQPALVPGTLTADGKTVDDPEFRQELVNKIKRYSVTLGVTVARLRRQGRVTPDVEFRFLRMDPPFKLCLINGDHAFEGVYHEFKETDFPFEHPDRIVLDPLGLDSMLTRWSRDGGKVAVEVIDERRKLFSKLWRVSRPPSW